VPCVTALLLTGTYSVSAALGSAMGGRAIAATEQYDIADKHAAAGLIRFPKEHL
jgi:hypothetical protein